MFDPVTDEALRLRRMGTSSPTPVAEPTSRTSLVCSVCGREIRPEEKVHWVGEEVHCFQCHSMLEYEYDKEREVDIDIRDKGTKWDKDQQD